MPSPADDLKTRWRAVKTDALVQLLAAAEADRASRWQAVRQEAQRLLARGGDSPHAIFMDECVPRLLGYGKDHDVAVAACLNMWRDEWEATHPGGEDDPGPDRPTDDEGSDKPRRRR